MRQPRRGPIRVVVVEDDHDFRDLLVVKLRRDGFAAVGIPDGREWASYLETAEFENQRPDVVISDVRLPGFDGLALLRSIRASRWTVPVILMTGFDDGDVASRAEQMGAVTVLSKPFDLDMLATLVESVTGIRRGPPPSHDLSPPRLLIADDDHDFVAYMRDLFVALVARDESTVVTAFSGTEALEALAYQGPFDLVLTDHRMPGPNGVQLVTMARYAGYDAPILIVTAFPGRDVERAVMRHEGVRLLPKTAEPEQIVGTAIELLGEGRTSSEP